MKKRLAALGVALAAMLSLVGTPAHAAVPTPAMTTFSVTGFCDWIPVKPFC
ncbi:hypothetical protein HJ590_11180 [Naumannella sp. ID2617S]|uniref:hypothetical protein n=1 Tax=Enemella dayhoffiae TaxID=2016507 RepID=UPI0014899D50|nr:hypothetical protein [Enemella dayhoffiae]NNG20125.1 hypothetical protein [Naumannella sp. ID2617S]